MFAKTIIDSDAFLDMPMSAQALYFHLAMRADDEGFVNSPKKIQRMVGAGDDDARLLITKNFLIPFDSGVVVIKHWRIHNYIQNDRFKPTAYRDERSLLTIKENGAYTVDTECIQDVSSSETQVSIGKVSIDKVSLVEDRKGDSKGKTKFSPPTLEDVKAYCSERGNAVDPEKFMDYYTANGWRVGKNPMKDWKAAVRNWERDDKPKAKQPEHKVEHGEDLDRLARRYGVG